jgi:hypothetical protein
LGDSGAAQIPAPEAPERSRAPEFLEYFIPDSLMQKCDLMYLCKYMPSYESNMKEMESILTGLNLFEIDTISPS